MEIPIFYSYSHRDDNFRKELEIHLELLRRSNFITEWSDREISPGSNWEEEINFNIQKAKIILLLVSPDFIASDYCYETETIFALEQHDKKQAVVIPIIIRPCLWKISQFKHLQVLPIEGKAVSIWDNRDLAWLNVSEGILKVISEVKEKYKLHIEDSKNVISNSEIKTGRDVHIGDRNIYNHSGIDKQININENTGQIHIGTGDKIGGDKSSERDGGNISNLIYEFLEEYSQWYFSPLRINKWGGRQIGYERLSKSNSVEIRKELEKMKAKGLVKTTKSTKGNTIYKLNR